MANQERKANLVPTKAVDKMLFRNMPGPVRQLQAQARKELRLKQRALWKAQNLSQ